jgi:tetratricopeptide (TPR) repeat protein
MPSSRIAFRNLLSLLPEVEILEGLRFALARRALADPAHAWSDVEEAGTVDIRVLDRAAVLEALKEAAAEARREVDEVYESIGAVLAAAVEGEASGAAERLIEAGSEREERGRYSAALRFFRAAFDASLPLGDRRAQVLAMRRMGRLMIYSGDVAGAEAAYRRSADLAADIGEAREEIIARTGLGNCYLRVGRWTEAEEAYGHGLALAEKTSGVDRERAQLQINIAQVLAHRGRYEEADGMLKSAAESTRRSGTPLDRALWHTSQAHILWEKGDLDGARQEYHAGLSEDLPDVRRALFAIDLSGVYLEAGDPQAARMWGREAEQSALAAGSVGYLTEVYRGLGNIARDTGGEPVALYEKSLEIARKNGLRLAEAKTLSDYARLQSATGNEEEAIAFLDHAIATFEVLGATEDARKAREQRERITPPPEQPRSMIMD